MIISNLGSAPWTSAGENLVYVLPFSIGVCIIILHLFSFFLSYLMKMKITIEVILKSMALAVLFGMFIDLFLYIHQLIYVPEQTITRYLYLFIGLNLVAIAICVYFQASSIYLPTDFLLKAFGKLDEKLYFSNNCLDNHSIIHRYDYYCISPANKWNWSEYIPIYVWYWLFDRSV